MTVTGTDGRQRCFGGGPGKEYYGAYHDEEWGVPCRDDTMLFEMLILEGAQAGLSWETVLKKRGGYRAAFHDFEVDRVAAMNDAELEDVLANGNIVRNRLKVWSARRNAAAFQALQRSHGSFDAWLWRWTDGAPIVNRPRSLADVPASTSLSDQISKALKAAGMNFVGSTIIYAYMQAAGLVNDHVEACWKHPH